jgi:ribosomal protein L32
VRIKVSRTRRVAYLPSLSLMLPFLPKYIIFSHEFLLLHCSPCFHPFNSCCIDEYLARTDIVACPACGQPKLAHHLCHSCYSQMSRGKSDLGYEEAQDVEKPPREGPVRGSGDTEKADQPGRDTTESPEAQDHPKSMPAWERREKGLFSGVLSPLTKWFRK